MSDNTDKLVLELFNKVKQKQKEIASVEKPKWKTHCSFSTDSNSDAIKDRVNIQTIADINRLVDIYGFLCHKQELFLKSAKALGVKVAGFKWMGFSLNDWEDDIKARIDQVGVTQKKEELKALEKRLDALITTEQRREMELAAIQKELADGGQI